MNEDLFIQKIIKLESDIEEVKTKLDNFVTGDEYLRGQDQIMKMLIKMDQEMAAFVSYSQRMDAKWQNHEVILQEHSQDIYSLKQKVS